MSVTLVVSRVNNVSFVRRKIGLQAQYSKSYCCDRVPIIYLSFPFFIICFILFFIICFILFFYYSFFYYITKYLSEANVLITSYPMPALRRLLHHLPHTIHVTIATPSCFVGSLRASWQPVTRWVVMSSFLRVCIDVKRDTFYGGWSSCFDSIFVFLVLCCL